MSVLINEKIDNLLKTTSRSFYPTLKYLPKKVRGQIGLLYLLARVADTIADSKSGETEELLILLREYNAVAQGTLEQLPDFSKLADIQDNAHEAELLRNVRDVVDGLMVYSEGDRQRMLECLDIIVGGQILDLERFGPAKFERRFFPSYGAVIGSLRFAYNRQVGSRVVFFGRLDFFLLIFCSG